MPIEFSNATVFFLWGGGDRNGKGKLGDAVSDIHDGEGRIGCRIS